MARSTMLGLLFVKLKYSCLQSGPIQHPAWPSSINVYIITAPPVMPIYKMESKQQPLTGFFELNIRVGAGTEDAMKLPFSALVADPVVIANMKEMAVASINDGYTCMKIYYCGLFVWYTRIVYNFIKNGGQLTEKDICPFKGFDLEKLWGEVEHRSLPNFTGGSPIKPNFSLIKQFTRLTLVCDDPKVVHQIMNLTSAEIKKTLIINSYDLFAIRSGDQESIFEQCCTKSDVDIIQIPLSQRMQFFINKTHVKQALQRGITFEVCYGSGCFEGSQANRKTFRDIHIVILKNAFKLFEFLMNAMNLVKASKGKGIIFSCESDRKIYQRSPVDIIQIAQTVGLTQEQAMASISTQIILVNINIVGETKIFSITFMIKQSQQFIKLTQSELCFKHAHLRQTFKGVAEIVELKERKGAGVATEEQMQIE